MNDKKIRIGVPTAFYPPTFGMHAHYVNWAAQFGQPILLTPGVNQIDAFDILLLPGGADVAEDNLSFLNTRSNPHLEWFDKFYIEKCVDHNKGIFGICRGMQTLNLFFGGSLVNLVGEELTLHQQNATESIKNKGVHHLNNVEKFYLNKIKTTEWDFPELKINSIHHQAIKEETLSDGFKIIAKCNDIIEAFEHKQYPICGVQWHPEKINDKLSNQMFKSLINKINV